MARDAGAIYDLLSSYPPIPFTYDSESQVFAVGDSAVPLLGYNSWLSPSLEPMSSAEIAQLTPNHGLLLNVFDEHVQTPLQHDWLRSLTSSQWRKMSNIATEAMIDAYATLTDQSRKKLLKGTHFGFGVELYRPGHPVFTVLGNCACYGVTPHGKIAGEESWDTGFSEYSEHNIDRFEQRVALHAGAGALAALVPQS